MWTLNAAEFFADLKNSDDHDLMALLTDILEKLDDCPAEIVDRQSYILTLENMRDFTVSEMLNRGFIFSESFAKCVVNR